MGLLVSLYQRLFAEEPFEACPDNSSGLTKDEKERLLSRLDINEKGIRDLEDQLKKLTSEITSLTKFVESLQKEMSAIHSELGLAKMDLDAIKRRQYNEILTPPKKRSMDDFSMD